MIHDTEADMQEFEAAMRSHGFNQPERAAGAAAWAPYKSTRDCDRYRGWCMARALLIQDEQRRRRQMCAATALDPA